MEIVSILFCKSKHQTKGRHARALLRSDYDRLVSDSDIKTYDIFILQAECKAVEFALSQHCMKIK